MKMNEVSLRGFSSTPRELSVDTSSTIKWWVNVSYGMHSDSKGHRGIMMTPGKGAAMRFLVSKQKLNAQSSTEVELIGADDVILQLTWGK